MEDENPTLEQTAEHEEPQPISRSPPPPPRSDNVHSRIIYPDPTKIMTQDETYKYVYLSPEWQIEERTRQNGPQAGKKYYLYTNLAILKKFRSLTTVEEYIRTNKIPERTLGKKKADTKKMKDDKSMEQPTVPGAKEIMDTTFTDVMGPDTHRTVGTLGVGNTTNNELVELPAETEEEREIYESIMAEVMGSDTQDQAGLQKMSLFPKNGAASSGTAAEPSQPEEGRGSEASKAFMTVADLEKLFPSTFFS